MTPVRIREVVARGVLVSLGPSDVQSTDGISCWPRLGALGAQSSGFGTILPLARSRDSEL